MFAKGMVMRGVAGTDRPAVRVYGVKGVAQCSPNFVRLLICQCFCTFTIEGAPRACGHPARVLLPVIQVPYRRANPSTLQNDRINIPSNLQSAAMVLHVAEHYSWCADKFGRLQRRGAAHRCRVSWRTLAIGGSAWQ
eukprot:SAG31_NODE_314_length_17854_cov_3.932075_5_plen_137_part_00